MLKRMTALLLVGGLVFAAENEDKKNLLLDAGLVYGVTLGVVLVNPEIRQNMFSRYSIHMVWDNFKDPICRAVEGGRRDDNGFLTNYVAHPLCFAGLALYLKARGYSNAGTMVFTQVHNIIWEYVIEGGLWYPSGQDLLTDLVSSLAGIYILHPLSDLGEKKIAEGRRGWGFRLLYYLNPFKEINKLIFGKKQHSLGLYITPLRRGFTLGLNVGVGP